MVEILTYTLKKGQKSSDDYFNVLRTFTDQINRAAKDSLGGWVKDYQEYIQTNNIEELRGLEVYAFELLTLGVLWPIYSQDALSLGKFSQWVLSKLAELRQKYSITKKIVDPIRGFWGNLVLTSKPNKYQPVLLDLANLTKLVKWLQATGEFKEEVKRFKGWQLFLANLSKKEQEEFLKDIIGFAEDFADQSQRVLGKYTPNVEQFIAERTPAHRWMEDRLLVSRERVEYHLNMFGMEILNRDVAKSFSATKKKIVFVPPCMRIKKEGCEAYETPLGDHCNACEPNCRVHQVTQLGTKHSFEVYFLPRRLSTLGKGRDKNQKPGFAVVGVACPLTMTTGGWQTRDMGIPAMGLPLDHCGCHWHWDLDEGIVTDMNFGELLKMVSGEK